MIHPRCKSDQKQIYIAADGLVFPCCWLGNEPSVREYRALHADYLNELNITQQPLDKILADPRFQKIAQSWDTQQPFPVCAHYCSKPLSGDEAQKWNGTSQKVKISLKKERS